MLRPKTSGEQKTEQLSNEQLTVAEQIDNTFSIIRDYNYCNCLLVCLIDANFFICNNEIGVIIRFEANRIIGYLAAANPKNRVMNQDTLKMHSIHLLNLFFHQCFRYLGRPQKIVQSTAHEQIFDTSQI